MHLDRDEFLADIGDRVRAERHARGCSQLALAERCGLPVKSVRHVECGTSPLPLFTLVELCHGLGISISYLLSDEWEMPARAEPVRKLTPLQARILREAVPGIPLATVARRVGTSRQAVAARLSEVYRLLGVSHLPREERREAAVRAAGARGLLPDVPVECTA
ncbi:helix-turn-helix domain-containing protein (plasmid) [Streptomyces sp. NBC_01353]